MNNKDRLKGAEYSINNPSCLREYYLKVVEDNDCEWIMENSRSLFLVNAITSYFIEEEDQEEKKVIFAYLQTLAGEYQENVVEYLLEHKDYGIDDEFDVLEFIFYCLSENGEELTSEMVEIFISHLNNEWSRADNPCQFQMYYKDFYMSLNSTYTGHFDGQWMCCIFTLNDYIGKGRVAIIGSGEKKQFKKIVDDKMYNLFLSQPEVEVRVMYYLMTSGEIYPLDFDPELKLSTELIKTGIDMFLSI